MRYRPLSFVLSLCALCACNSTSSDRFTNQKDSYYFSSTSSSLTAYGASSVPNRGSNAFKCPAVSGMNAESNVTVFYAQANTPMPHFELDTIAGIRGDTQGGFGISLSNMPIGLLDIYQRCGSSNREKWTTFCPAEYPIVESCENVPEGTNACALVYEGDFRLVVSAQMANDKTCISEEIDRSPYSLQSTPYPAYACDAFEPIELPAAYRGETPNNDCCSIQGYSAIDFCLKPCGCRKLTVSLVPKSEIVASPDASNTVSFDHDLKIAVFSNVEDNDSAFLDLIESIQKRDVDFIVSLGNLTHSGSPDAFQEKRTLVDLMFTAYDGIFNGTGCSITEDMICCPSSEDRLFSGTCNVILDKTAFLAGLGENEYGGELGTFNALFGPSYASTVVGKVQMIMLDTADAGIPEAEMNWLRNVLKTPEKATCHVPESPNGEWPSLAECREKLSSSKNVTCRDCIEREAYCIPPAADRSDASLGPENCICVPAESKICPDNRVCRETGTESECICTRDSDCGKGGTCNNGVCKPPLRMVFSYTPLYDEFGSRNNSFTSKTDAAALLSLLGKAGVSAIFSGRVRDYAKFSKAGIDMYITGGGGADMTSFARKGHHWLLVTVPNAYTNPDPDDISVEVVEF